MEPKLQQAHKIAQAIPYLPSGDVKRKALHQMFELFKQGLCNG